MRPCLTLDIVPVITDTEVFIEDSAVSTVKGVLFSILVTEMINLKCQFVQTSYELIVLLNREKFQVQSCNGYVFIKPVKCLSVWSPPSERT